MSARRNIASAENMFGDSYKAIIRNIPIQYGDAIVEQLMENNDQEFEGDREKLIFLFESAISADNVDIDDNHVNLTITGCNHHRALVIEEKFGLDKLRVCPGGIIGTCLIEYIIGFSRCWREKKIPVDIMKPGFVP